MRARRLLATLFASALMVFGVTAPANAQQQQNGLVNVQIGDITIEDVNLAVAANIAANVCATDFADVLVLAVQVDRTGEARTVCTTGDQVVRFTQA